MASDPQNDGDATVASSLASTKDYQEWFSGDEVSDYESGQGSKESDDDESEWGGDDAVAYAV